MADENALVVDKRELAQVVEQVQSFQDLLGKDAFKRQLAMALPRHITPDRLLRVVMTALRTNPKLMECTMQSLYACVMASAQLGLVPDGFLGQAYYVPFNNSYNVNGKWVKKLEATFIPGYRGLITLARQSGDIKGVDAEVVFSNDEFEISFGTNRYIKHSPCLSDDRGEAIGAYAVFVLADDSVTFDFMTKADIEKIRKTSKNADGKAWTGSWDEMAKKTVIRRKIKYIPLSVEKPEANRFATAVALDDIATIGKSQLPMLLDEPEQDDEVIDVSGPSALAAEAAQKSRRGRPTKVAADKPAEIPATDEAPGTAPADPGPPAEEGVDIKELLNAALKGLATKRVQEIAKACCANHIHPVNDSERAAMLDMANAEKKT